MGTNNKTIRKKAMLKNLNLKELRQNGTKYESAVVEEERISGAAVN